MEFYVFDTMTGTKELFVPLKEEYAGIYACGPTVHNYAHIGNLRKYIFDDVLKKSLQYVGMNVKLVMNVTDVGHLQSDADEGEDKMAMGAKRENKTPWEIARFYEEVFFHDCAKLNISRPDVVCRATEHIDDMIKLIRKLEEKGYTYVSNGNVYFEIDKFKDYNRLAGLSMEELEAGRRIEVDPNKKNPLDFVLWFINSKFANQTMQWESPWGRGYPGWHIECSAMSLKYLGERIDIHTGGVDHIPVHHTNELAQSEGALGHKWVNYWMHSEFLVNDGVKMSKSNGDFLTLAKMESEGFKPLDYRYFCLQSRYRKQLMFSFDTLKEAQTAFAKLKSKIAAIVEAVNSDDIVNKAEVSKYTAKFQEQISDDLNIPNAFTVLYDVLKDNELNNLEKLQLIEDFDRVFSLGLTRCEAQDNIDDRNFIDEALVNALIEERNRARKLKDWPRADEIRDRLSSMNIRLIDTADSTTWQK